METEIDVTRRQGTPGARRDWMRQGMISPMNLWRECGIADTLILDFWTPEFQENNCLF